MAMTSTSPLQQAVSSTLHHLQALLLRNILEEWSPKLSIDGAAKVITSSVETAEALAQWTHDSYRDQPYSITIREEHCEKDIDPKLARLATISATTRVEDQSATHAFSHMERYRREEALWVFKRIFYALLPKGIAVVTCWRRNPILEVWDEVLGALGCDEKSEAVEEAVEELRDGQLADLAEEAQFERGKIRSYQKEVAIPGEELRKIISDLRAGLKSVLGSCEDGRGWSAALDEGIKKRLSEDGSLKSEAELILAMRWDLLCA